MPLHPSALCFLLPRLASAIRRLDIYQHLFGQVIKRVGKIADSGHKQGQKYIGLGFWEAGRTPLPNLFWSNPPGKALSFCYCYCYGALAHKLGKLTNLLNPDFVNANANSSAQAEEII